MADIREVVAEAVYDIADLLDLPEQGLLIHRIRSLDLPAEDVELALLDAELIEARMGMTRIDTFIASGDKQGVKRALADIYALIKNTEKLGTLCETFFDPSVIDRKVEELMC